VTASASERFIRVKNSFGIPVWLSAIERKDKPEPPEKPHSLLLRGSALDKAEAAKDEDGNVSRN
jgi:hypothetical protein